MRFKDWFLKEDFEQWNGRWIHYSRSPYMKINFQTMWRDPLGIYFFPEKFESQTAGQWHTFPYKFIVEFPPDMKVFDFAKYTLEDYKKILAKHGMEADKDEEPGKPAHFFWASVRNHFGDKYGGVQRAQMNAFFRKALGADAIFDDTDAIYPGEHQLILLNPQIKLRVVDVVKRGGSGWQELNAVLSHMKAICDEYGVVKVSHPKKEYSGWSQENQIITRFTVNENKWKEGPYVSFKVYTRRVESGRPEEISVYLDWASHGFQKRNGTIAHTVYTRKMDLNALDEFMKDVMDTIWQAAAEEKQGTLVGANEL